MLRHSIVGLLALGLFTADSVRAEDEYDLRGPNPVKGQVYILTAKSTGKNLVRNIKVGDKSIEEKFDEVTTKKKEIEVLGVDGFDITKMRTKVITDQRNEFTRRGKKEVKKTTDRDLQGQYIYSERLKTGWKNSLEDVTPNDKQKTALKEYVPFKEEDTFYPAGKIKVGQSWKIDQAMMDRVIGKQFEEMKGSGTGKLLRVEKDKGEDIAVIEVEFEVTGKEKEDDLSFDVTIKGKGQAYRSLKLGFDRRSTTVLEISMKGGGESDGQKIEMDFKGTMNAEDLIELKEKK